MKQHRLKIIKCKHKQTIPKKLVTKKDAKKFNKDSFEICFHKEHTLFRPKAIPVFKNKKSIHFSERNHDSSQIPV